MYTDDIEQHHLTEMTTHTHTLAILKRALQTKAKNRCWSNVQYENDNVAIYLFIFLPGHLNPEHRETTTPTVSVERPFHLKCMSWGCARKPMQAQGDHAKAHLLWDDTHTTVLLRVSHSNFRRTSDLCTDSTHTLFLLPPLHPDFQNSDIDRLKQLETMGCCSTENEWTWMSMNLFT